nr:putative ribonuclease H-like domain-containing protein [Tanacetum cinerariifolium]
MLSSVKLPILKKGEYILWTMKIEQYLAYTNYALWEVILNGNSAVQMTKDKDGNEVKVPPVAAQQILARTRERKYKSTPFMAILDEHLARFHRIKDAKTLWAAIKTRFGANAESKKMQKNVLKQQFENFSVSNLEGLDKGYDRFQRLLSMLGIHGIVVSTEDANQNFLRSLPSAWSNISLIMRNKSGIDNLDIDDLYTNLKVYEADIKGSSVSSSNSQNVALSLQKAPAALMNLMLLIVFILLHAIVLRYKVPHRDDENATNPPTIPPIPQAPHTLSTIKLPILKKGEYDIWAMKMEHYLAHIDYPIWEVIQKGNGPIQVSTDTNGQIRVLRPKTGVSTEDANRKFLRVFKYDVKGSTASSSSTHNVAFVSSDSTNSTNEVSNAYGVSTSSSHNSQKKGSSSYTDDLISKGNQEGRRRDARNTGYKARDNERRPTKQDEHKAMVTIDGEGVDWTGHAEDDTENYDLMAFNSSNSSSDTEVTSCSKVCEKSYAKLKKLYDEQREQLGVASIEIQAYTLALKKVEAQLVYHQKNQLAYEEKISQMSAKDKSRLRYGNQIHEGALSYKTKVLESMFNSRFSDVKDSHVNDRFVKVEGMHVVPSPMTGIYMPPKSNFGIDESKFTYGHKQSKTSEFDVKTNNLDSCESNSSVETLELVPKPIESKPKAVTEPKVWSDAPIIKEQTVKDQDTCSQNPKVPKRDWTGLMSKRIGLESGYNRNACFVCGSFSPLIRDCDFHKKRMAKQVELNKSKNKVTCQRNNTPVWNNVQRINHQNKFVLIAILTKSGIFPVNAARQNFSSQVTLTSAVRKVNNASPIVNEIRPGHNVYKSHLPIRWPFNRTPAPKAKFANHKLHIAGDKTVSVVEGNQETADNPHQSFKGKCIIDSGCSRYMTENKAYFVEYQDFNGGPVAFGGIKGQITGKGKLRTRKLDFEDVYFVKELQHFNLFFVSQMCDKKNKVLFTNTECLVLSTDFKLPNENQVLLRVHRQNNMYSFYLENIIPFGGLACLIAKATIDKSNKWHRILGHVNFKNLNKLVKGNLVKGLPSKIFLNDHSCVACHKGKQHKASYKVKLVSSISQSLQILHMDLFGPTSDETSGILKDFIRQTENQLNQKVKTIRCDNGIKFKNKDIIEFYASKGIKRKYSNARTPQQNGVAERKNRTLIEAARTMLANSFLSNTFLAEAVSTTCYVLNRVLVTKPQNKTPYEHLTGKIPIISYIRPFGCHVTILNTIDHLGKFKEKYDEGFLVGYSLNSKAFKPVTAENKANKTAGPKKASTSAGAARSSNTNYVNTASTLVNTASTTVNTASTPVNTASPSRNVSNARPSYPDLLTYANQDDYQIPNLGISMKFQMMGFLQVIHSIHPTTQILRDPTSAVQTRIKVKKSLGAHAFVSYIQKQRRNNHKDFQYCLFACFLSQIEPKRYLKHLKMKVRLMLYRNSCCNSKLSKFGFWLTYLLGKRIEAIRIFLAFASYMGFIVYQMDVKSAFLYGKINEEVYISQPLGFIDPKFSKKVYKVVNSLYGLHQAPRAWYATLFTFLVQSGCKRGLIDKTLFIKKDKKDIMLVQVYVDDIIFGSTKKSWCDEFEALMKSRFQMSSMGELTFFLGLQVKQKKDGIFISHDKYVAKILKKFDFMSVKTASTPIETKKPLVKDAEATDVDVHLYRSMIGSLMYLTASRPDIMYAVYACSRFQVTPKTLYLHDVKRIFRYLKDQPKLGLWYTRESSFDLEAYSDSDYARANLDRKSTTREYVAAASYCGQVLWIQNQMVKVLNAKAEGVSAVGETLSTATLAVSTAISLDLSRLATTLNRLERSIQTGIHTKVKYINCHRIGHFARDCRSARNLGNMSRDVGNAGYRGRNNAKRTTKEEVENALVVQDVLEEEVTETVFDNRSSDEENSLANDRFKKGEGYHAVPPPLTGNYMPPKSDLSFARLDDSIIRLR